MNIRSSFHRSIGAFALCMPMLVTAQFYSGAQQEFGKNRVQYQDFLWQYYRWDDLETYFYAGGKDIAQYVAQAAHYHMRDLQKRLDITIDGRLQFIVYGSLSDMRQSNIGINDQEDNNIGGVTRIVGTKVFVYFEGDHELLDRQVRSGVARVMLEQMMYGGNWKDVVKNSTLLNLPTWFTEGLISYISRPLDAQLRSDLKDAVVSGRFDKFNRLRDAEMALAGHAVWNYVAEVYGENVIPNILYMTRISRNAESGFLYVLGISLRTLINESLAYYRQRAAEDDQFRTDVRIDPLPIRTKRSRAYSQFKLSPDGRNVIFVSNELGQYKVWLRDLSTNRTKRIIKGEHKLARIVDRSYPVLAWHPSGRAFSFVIERKGELFLTTYTLDDKKKTTRPVFMLEKVLDMDYSDDGRQLIFSAVRDGRSDLYLYHVIGNRQEQLTDDQYDDLQPRFIKGSNGVIFSSDRPDDTLRVKDNITYHKGAKDIFIFNMNTRSPVLERLTNTPVVNETMPAQLDSVNYTYLSDVDGIWNRYILRFDSVISHVDTAIHYRRIPVELRASDLRRGLLEQDIVHQRGRYAQMVFSDGRYRFYSGMVSDILGSEPQSSSPNGEKEQRATIEDRIEIDGPETIIKVDPSPPSDRVGEEVNIWNYTFIGDEEAPQQKRPVQVQQAEFQVIDPTLPKTGSPTTKDDQAVAFPEQRNYNLNFATDQVLTQVDNSYSDQFYQFLYGAGSLNPGISGLMQMGISDLFEDYSIVGGVRLALNLNNNDYQVSFQNLKRRLDKKLTMQRQANQLLTQIGVVKGHTHQIKYQVSYPFSEVTSLRATILYRHDRLVLQSTDLFTLREENFYDHMAGAKLEYVFDNTIKKGLNLYNGWRFKFFAEYYQQPDEQNSDMQVVGMDIRHALKVHRDIIWVNRIAGSSSFGSRRILFFLGGVDNWFFPKVDESIPIDLTQNYFYQSMSTPMRGFYYNARNGSSFSVLNSELRVPIFRYLLNRPIRSDVVHNFQIVAFGDLGTAWTGSEPYADDNSFNTLNIDQNPLTISIRNQREPIVAGYGFGMRTRLLGYFVRADWAWGIDDGVMLPGLFYFSLSLDI